MRNSAAERLDAIPSAEGGMTRLAFACAQEKGADVDTLLRKAGLSRAQIFMRSRLPPIRFGKATRRGVRPSVYHPTGLVRRRAASRGAAATSPSADRASATLIGLDPK